MVWLELSCARRRIAPFMHSYSSMVTKKTKSYVACMSSKWSGSHDPVTPDTKPTMFFLRSLFTDATHIEVSHEVVRSFFAYAYVCTCKRRRRPQGGAEGPPRLIGGSWGRSPFYATMSFAHRACRRLCLRSVWCLITALLARPRVASPEPCRGGWGRCLCGKTREQASVYLSTRTILEWPGSSVSLTTYLLQGTQAAQKLPLLLKGRVTTTTASTYQPRAGFQQLKCPAPPPPPPRYCMCMCMYMYRFSSHTT